MAWLYNRFCFLMPFGESLQIVHKSDEAEYLREMISICLQNRRLESFSL